ncbi:MAG: DUF1624 domain-containing protein [Bacteroidetes bacterium]|nr:DUF1624 domain-containing protein [Bacteroidota bacterium]MCW5896422.1 DUF1624 domain-containing protein [Bacteroidota bacterium]
MPEYSSQASSLKSRRVEYIDLLRGWAVLVMIETHVMNATLANEIVESDFFRWVKFANGLVAPSFLFASGLAYAVTSRRKLGDYLSFGPGLYKQIRRLLFVVMIGYLLHIPKFNFRQIIAETTELSWQIFFQADVLQCIGVSLLLIQLLLFLLRTEKRLYVAVTGLAVLIPFVTPFIWGIDFREILPLPLAGYMNGIHFPQFPGFPLFPWMAFLFAGAAFGFFSLRAKDVSVNPESKYNENALMKQVLWIAPVMIAVSILIEPLAATIYPSYNYGLSSPSFFFLRLGIVMILCAGLYFYEKIVAVSQKSIITLVGRESLIVYTLHLFLIYGDFGPYGFSKIVNHTFGYTEALFTTTILIGIMILAALWWSSIRKKKIHVKQRIQWAVAAGMVIVFFFGPKG